MKIRDLKKFGLAFLALSMIMMTTVGCQSEKETAASADTIKIGVAVPLTGDCAQDGIEIKLATELAAKEINDAGGIDGKMIKVVAYDDKADPKEAAVVANKLAEEKGILGVVGHYNSSCSLAAAPIYNKAGVVHVSPASSAPSLSDAGEYTFRDVNSDEIQGALIAEWSVNELGLDKCAIIYENSDYGLGNASSFEEAALKLGATIVSKDTYLSSQTKDFTSILTNIKNSEANMVFIGGLYNECAMILKQAKQVGLDIQIMGTDAVYSTSLTSLAGEAGEGFLLIGFYHKDSPSELNKSFLPNYTAYAGTEPGTYAANGYDAARVILEAIAKGGIERKAVRDALAETKDFPGVSGDITFDKNGDVRKESMKLIIKNGEFALYE